MRILTVSDRVEPLLYERFDKRFFPAVDLVLSCGDLPPEYLTFLASTFKVPLFYVRGNHDIRYDTSPPQGCESLDGRMIRFRGRTFLGLDGSRWYNGGPNQYTDAQMRKKIRRLRLTIWWKQGLDVMITHAPPRYIHDAEDPCHKGFKSFGTVIDRYSPGYLIHGHIHTNFTNAEARVTMVNQTRVINTYNYHLIEMDDGQPD